MSFRDDWKRKEVAQAQRPKLVCLVYEAARKAAMHAKSSGAKEADISMKAL